LRSTSDRWTPEPFTDDDGDIPFERFADDLSDFKFSALYTAIDRVLSVRGIDLARTEWLKALGKGLHEFRVRHDADEIAHMFGGDPPWVAAPAGKILLRVFVHFYGDKVILLLGGYDKGADSTESRQQREIAEARRRLTQFQERRRRQRGQASRLKKGKRRS
jgi:hypothetical protein